MLTKDDLMKLSKERLCELLLEAWENDPSRFVPTDTIDARFTPCYAPNGICTNPSHDCINCPRQSSGNGTTFSTDGTDYNQIIK